jgi:hypothetical protein
MCYSSADFSDWFRLKGKSHQYSWSFFFFFNKFCVYLNYSLSVLEGFGGLGGGGGCRPAAHHLCVCPSLYVHALYQNHPVSWFWCFGMCCHLMWYIVTNILDASMQAQVFYGFSTSPPPLPNIVICWSMEQKVSNVCFLEAPALLSRCLV